MARTEEAVACYDPYHLFRFYGSDLHDPGPHDWQPEQPETLNCARPGTKSTWRFEVATQFGDIVGLHFDSAEPTIIYMRTRDVMRVGNVSDHPGWWDGSTLAQ